MPSRTRGQKDAISRLTFAVCALRPAFLQRPVTCPQLSRGAKALPQRKLDVLDTPLDDIFQLPSGRRD